MTRAQPRTVADRLVTVYLAPARGRRDLFAADTGPAPAGLFFWGLRPVMSF